MERKGIVDRSIVVVQSGPNGADLAIDFGDGRDNVWIPFAPQSWLSAHWRPEAVRQGWSWVERACDNVCQIYRVEDVAALLQQLQALRIFVKNLETIDKRIVDQMSERLDRSIQAVSAAVHADGCFEFLSIG